MASVEPNIIKAPPLPTTTSSLAPTLSAPLYPTSTSTNLPTHNSPGLPPTLAISVAVGVSFLLLCTIVWVVLGHYVHAKRRKAKAKAGLERYKKRLEMMGEERWNESDDTLMSVSSGGTPPKGKNASAVDEKGWKVDAPSLISPPPTARKQANGHAYYNPRYEAPLASRNPAFGDVDRDQIQRMISGNRHGRPSPSTPSPLAQTHTATATSTSTLHTAPAYPNAVYDSNSNHTKTQEYGGGPANTTLTIESPPLPAYSPDGKTQAALNADAQAQNQSRSSPIPSSPRRNASRRAPIDSHYVHAQRHRQTPQSQSPSTWHTTGTPPPAYLSYPPTVYVDPYPQPSDYQYHEYETPLRVHDENAGASNRRTRRLLGPEYWERAEGSMAEEYKVEVMCGKRAEAGYLDDVRAKSPSGSFEDLMSTSTSAHINTFDDGLEHAYGAQSHSYIEIRLDGADEGGPTPTEEGAAAGGKASTRGGMGHERQTSHMDFPSTFPPVNPSLNERTPSWIPQESWMGGNLAVV